ncbi:hypothetical protein [Sulfuriferula sp.]|uniref:hypothetical protein n=1 Tax=Sulfuriferula sp. TaxID=2025307 RepID=UPI002731761B|nr:hypothetical protein [Sulfuriferula sp.]MDP2024842.1 hypothetical protein [Sulfuriferula sp.]
MSTVQNHLAGTSMLFRALDAAKNWRALGLLIATSICAILVMSVFGFIASRFGYGTLTMLTGGLGTLLALIVFFTGFSAVGILLMDQAKTNLPRALSNALFAGLATLPRFFGLMLIELALALAFVVVAALILFICKIPALGPFLYTFVYPILVVIIGVLYFAVVFVVNPLAAPALWDGNNVMQALAKLWQLGKNFLIPVVLNQLVLGLIVFVVAGILFGMMAIGSVATSGLSAMILGPEVSGSLVGLFNGMMAGGAGASGYGLALMFGSGILFAVVGAIPLLVLISGNCLIYLQYARDLDTSAIEEKMRGAVGDLKDKANAAREQLKQAQVPPPSAAGASALTEPALACPNCHAAITSDDAFCGSCGHKLK